MRRTAVALGVGLLSACDPTPGPLDASGDPIPVPKVCEDYCAVDSTCLDVDVEECEGECTEDMEESGIGGVMCRVAFEELLRCIATLTCDEYATWVEPMGATEYPCSDFDAAFEVSCQTGM